MSDKYSLMNDKFSQVHLQQYYAAIKEYENTRNVLNLLFGSLQLVTCGQGSDASGSDRPHDDHALENSRHSKSGKADHMPHHSRMRFSIGSLRVAPTDHTSNNSENHRTQSIGSLHVKLMAFLGLSKVHQGRAYERELARDQIPSSPMRSPVRARNSMVTAHSSYAKPAKNDANSADLHRALVRFVNDAMVECTLLENTTEGKTHRMLEENKEKFQDLSAKQLKASEDIQIELQAKSDVVAPCTTSSGNFIAPACSVEPDVVAMIEALTKSVQSLQMTVESQWVQMEQVAIAHQQELRQLKATFDREKTKKRHRKQEKAVDSDVLVR